MLAKGINCPQTSSLGRLFDAVGALLGLGDDATYDGSVACALEAALYDPATQEPVESTGLVAGEPMESVGKPPTYHFKLQGEEILVEPVVRGILDSLEAGTTVPLISRAFHDAVVEMMVRVCQEQRQALGQALGDGIAGTVALSGGCFMNRYLLTKVWRDLEEQGFTVLLNQQLPANDGCIAYGQAAVAAAAAAMSDASATCK